MTEKSIKLVQLKARDADEMFHVLIAPEIYKYISEKPYQSVEELRKRFQTLERGCSSDGQEIWLNWIIRKEDSLEAIGYVQSTISRQNNNASIAYVLNPKYWGQGFASKAVTLMLELLENEYKVRFFVAEVDWQNKNSIRLLERLSFKKIGEKVTELIAGVPSRDIIMELHTATVTSRVYSCAPWEKKVGYCRAVKRGNFISVSGTTPVDDSGEIFEPNNAYAQAKRCIKIIERALIEIGSDLSEIVRTRMFVTDITRWEEFGRAHEEAFRNYPPATSMVEVKSLIAPGMLIEIEADAVAGRPKF